LWGVRTGKSTLTNRILGEDRVVVYDMPGTTRDSIYIPMQRDEREYVLIDTAGVRKRGKITDVVEKFSVIKTLQAIEDANVVMLVIDAREGISDQDLSLLGFILNSGRSLVIVVNKWDGLSQEVREQVKRRWTSVWALSTLPVCTLSPHCTAAASVTCSNPYAKRMTARPVASAPRC
jgi:GTP-binding protein